MNYNYNNNNSYLKQLKHPENIEILCAEPCLQNCPNRVAHYKNVSEMILGLNDTFYAMEQCPMHNKHTFLSTSDIQLLPNAVTNKRVEELSQLGIKYFKISGRQLPPLILLEVILYYLVLTEYHQRVREEILAQIKF